MSELDGLDVARGTGKITTLLLVDSHPGIRPSVIAQIIMKDRSAMGRLIDQMIDHDLLVRQTSASERRAHELFVTAKGAELAAKIRPIVTKQSKDFFSFICGRRASATHGYSAPGVPENGGNEMKCQEQVWRKNVWLSYQELIGV